MFRHIHTEANAHLYIFLHGIELLKLHLLLVVVDRSDEHNHRNGREDGDPLQTARLRAVPAHKIAGDEGEDARRNQSIQCHILSASTNTQKKIQ
jgi:hypothetical protein